MTTKMLNGSNSDLPILNRMEQKNMTPQADLLQTNWEKPKEFLDPKALEHYQLQCNLAREQMTNCVREMVAIRQDVNSLRLADSQHEMQQCEITRHVREMQASIQQELTTVAAPVLSVSNRLDLVSQAQEQAVQDCQHVQDQLSKVAQVVEAERRERVAIEERCIKSVADLRSELKLVMDTDREELLKVQTTVKGESERQIASMEGLSSEIQTIAKTVTAESQERCIAVETSIRQALAERTEEVMQELKESTVELEKSFEAALGILRAGLADETGNRMNEFARLTDSIESLQGQPAVFQMTVDNLDRKIQNLQGDFSDLGAELQSRQAELKELKEVAARTENQTSELQLLQDDFRNQLVVLNKASEKSSEAQTEIRNHICKVSAQESEARKDQQAGLLASLESADSRLRALIADNKTGIDRHRASIQEQLERQRQAIADQFEQTHGSIADHLEDVDRRLKSSVSQLSAAQGSQQTSFAGLHKDLERKLRDELADASKDFHERHAELKDLVSKEKHVREKQTDSIDSLEASIRRELAQHQSQWEKQHNGFREQLSRDRMGLDTKHDTVISRLEDVERRVREPVQIPMPPPVEPGLDRDTAQLMLANLERKLRDELSGHSTEHRCRHQDLKEQLSQLSGEHSANVSKVNDMTARLSAQERTMRDENHNFVTASLNALEQRLRREVADQEALASNQHVAMRESITQEQRAREKHSGSIALRLEEVERNLHEAHATELRKLREETSLEHGNRSAELKDLIGKMCAQEAAAREDIRSSFMAALEALGMKHRREVEDGKSWSEKQSIILREQLSKERQDREAHLTNISTSVGTLERRVRDELEKKLEDHRNNVLELKDLILKSVAVEKAVREEMHVTLDSSLQALEVQFRQELGPNFGGDVCIREQVAQERQQREQAIALLTEQLALVEQQLVAELRQGACAWEASEAEIRILLSDTSAKDRARVQELLGREQMRDSVQEGLLTQMAQEKTAREDLQEKVQTLVAQERIVRDSLQEALKERVDGLERASSLVLQDAVPRSEFESVMRRICEVVDSHSYNLAVRHPAETRQPLQTPWLSKAATGASSSPAEVSTTMPSTPLKPFYESQSYAAPAANLNSALEKASESNAAASASQMRRGPAATADSTREIPASVTYAETPIVTILRDPVSAETVSYPQELSWPVGQGTDHSVSATSMQQARPATAYISTDQIEQLTNGAARCFGAAFNDVGYPSGMHERGSRPASHDQ